MKHHQGQIEVVCGSMFCGKTEELLRRVRRAVIAKQRIQVFKPALDTRYHAARVTSHNGTGIEAQAVGSASEILTALAPDTTVVAVDEVQFFDDEVVAVCDALAEQGVRVICAGLDTDFRGQPFGPMPQLLARAEFVDKLQAICVLCGEAASRTQRLINGEPACYDDPIVLIGADEVYEARCRSCHTVRRRDAGASAAAEAPIYSEASHAA